MEWLLVTNLQQLCDAIMSIWTKMEECFQHHVKSMPRRIKAVLKAKGVQPGTSLIKWPVSVCRPMCECMNGVTYSFKN